MNRYWPSMTRGRVDTLKSVVGERPSMSGRTAHGDAAGPGELANGDDVWARDTAPQTPYTLRQVGIGLVVFVALAVVAFGVPLALA